MPTVIDPLVNVTAATVSVASFNCKVPPFTVTAPLLDNTVPIDAPVPSKIKVPADTVVPPV